MYDFTIKQGDTKTILKATLYYPAGSVVDLTGASAQLVLSDQGTRLLTKTATIMDATNGILFIQFGSSDLNSISGWVKGELKVTFPDLTVETFPNDSYLKINVVKSL